MTNWGLWSGTFFRRRRLLGRPSGSVGWEHDRDLFTDPGFGKVLLVTLGIQAFWHTRTGYFPVTTAALDEPEDKAFLAENPLFQVAIDSLDAPEVQPATTGCAAGAMPQIRKATEEGLERALIGRGPAASLQQVKEDVAESIATYHDSVG